MTQTLKTFVISLDRAKDRFLKTKEALAGLDFLEIEHWSATDGRTLSPQDYTLSPHLFWATGAKGISPVEIACYLSHFRLWTHIAEHAIPYALVLEDDTMPLPLCAEALLALLPHLNDYDLVRLCYLPIAPWRHRPLKPFDSTLSPDLPHRLTCALGHVTSTEAYLVTLRGAQKLSTLKEIMAPVDYFAWYGKRAQVYSPTLTPQIFACRPQTPSQITPLAQRPLWKKWAMTIPRLCMQAVMLGVTYQEYRRLKHTLEKTRS